MKKYELMFIVPANDNNESSAKAVISEVKAELEKRWWKIFYEEFWGLMNLAYKIKHNTQWFYQVFNLELDWLKITEIESKFFNINNNVIRYLFTKIEDDENEEYIPYTHEQFIEDNEKRLKEKEDKKRKPAPKKDFKKDFKKDDKDSKKEWKFEATKVESK